MEHWTPTGVKPKDYDDDNDDDCCCSYNLNKILYWPAGIVFASNGQEWIYYYSRCSSLVNLIIISSWPLRY